MSIRFTETRKILEILEKIETFSDSERDILEDILKKACVLRFMAEFEYNLINCVLGENIENKAKKDFRKKVLKELKYKYIKYIFKDSFWREIENEASRMLREEYQYRDFDPKTDAPFDDYVDIRNDLAHLDSPRRQIDINTLKKCIDYMEALVNVLNSKLRG